MRFRAKMLFSTQIRRSLLMKKIVNENKKIKKEYKSIDYKNQNEMKWNDRTRWLASKNGESYCER